MLKMIIVEDEKLEREGLVDFFEWESMGIEICGLAVDGIEGVELAKKIKPDIIMTDIKMPGMDGIKMSKEIRSFLPNSKILILTGYDDFNYAKEAIGFRANAYILKPVEEEEILSSIKEVIEQCNSEQTLETRLTKGYYSEKRKFLFDFLNNNFDFRLAEGQLKEYGIQIDEGYKFCIISLKVFEETNKERLKEIISDVRRTIDETIIFEMNEDENNSLFYCIQITDDKIEQLSNKIKEIVSKLNSDINNIVGVISKTNNDLIMLKEAYQYVNSTIEYAIFWDIRGFINSDDLELYISEFNKGVGEFIIKGNEFTKKILKATGESEYEEVNKILEEIFTGLEDYKNIDKKYIINYLYNIIYETTLLAYNLNKNETEVFSGKNTLGNYIYELKSISQMKNYILSFYDKVLRIIDDKRNKKDEYIINRVIKQVEEHYSGDLSLKTISTEVFLSPNYLGNLFKKYTGKAFSDYLSDYRMGKARELLTTTNKKISVIATEVGIANTSYFCIVFKNVNGMSPQEYREMILR